MVLLTREGCTQTEQMRISLDKALAKMDDKRLAYREVDLASLEADDPRRGFPTPTVLYQNRDLFGMPTPAPPFPEPT